MTGAISMTACQMIRQDQKPGGWVGADCRGALRGTGVIADRCNENLLLMEFNVILITKV